MTEELFSRERKKPTPKVSKTKTNKNKINKKQIKNPSIPSIMRTTRQGRGGGRGNNGAKIDDFIKASEMKKGSLPRRSSRVTRNLRNEERDRRIKDILSVSEDYPPTATEWKAAESVYDIEDQIKHNNDKEKESELEKELKSAMIKVLRLTSGRMKKSGSDTKQKPINLDTEDEVMEIDDSEKEASDQEEGSMEIENLSDDTSRGKKRKGNEIVETTQAADNSSLGNNKKTGSEKRKHNSKTGKKRKLQKQVMIPTKMTQVN